MALVSLSCSNTSISENTNLGINNVSVANDSTRTHDIFGIECGMKRLEDQRQNYEGVSSQNDVNNIVKYFY